MESPTLADLVDIHEITELKYRYARTLDNKMWDEFAETLTEDLQATYGTAVHGAPLEFTSRAEVVDYMRTSLTTDITSVHTMSHPEIQVDGDTATGSWAMSDVVIVPAHSVVITGTSYYTDRYRRGVDGKWRISYISYYRLYEAMQNTKEIGFNLIANRWSQ
ncbi:nuclear transport factor 2 family protein [Mycobacterium sp. CBMA271]|uniref:nuclear transport factor 2 family protein n=1 Tax=unclassified Mycobacteroides TaxID=2618759 RepID=UPI0012DF1E87|nr:MULTISPECIES: nuclear transport factor 2 family protein [unclassified Mycobacteroides]MUM16698.1 bile-acid 7-alpha-dehydratase [Mycobacteroides sp. CBMA 326]MUM22909.1 nuclear transport factor 2 family protein [Mycobacteroides sp. CBMA 271]